LKSRNLGRSSIEVDLLEALVADVEVDEKEVVLVSNGLSDLLELMIFSFVSELLLSIESKTRDVFNVAGKCILEQTLTRLDSKLFKIPDD
jgi:hypothetical protein